MRITSYVLTCSNDFHSTLENIVKGLNKAGFSRKDYRIGEDVKPTDEQSSETEYVQTELLVPKMMEADTFEDITVEEVKIALETSTEFTNQTVMSMEQKAKQVVQDYQTEITENSNHGFEFMGGEIGDMLKQYGIQPQYGEEAKNLHIPQFFLQSVPDLFGDTYELLEPEHLSEGFSLSGLDAQISFELATGEMYQVDIQEQGEAVPKYKRAGKDESDYIREYLAKLPQEKKIRHCIDMICHQINKNNRYATVEIED